MKIKRKVEMNLPQLIEWAWENSITNLSFRGHGKEGYLVVASFNDKGEFTSEWCIYKDDIFEIEVEEEITEDTELDLIERFVGAMGYSCYTTHRMTIKECLRRSPEECTTTHFYIENDDQELILIWRDGKLVE